MRRYLRRFGDRSSRAADVKAGLVLGVESVPDSLAAGMLAGVNPLHGLYAYLYGTAAGALATGSVFMSVQATGAMAVVVADVNAGTEGGLSAGGLATLTLLAGLIMLGLGLAGWGSLVRFIPGAVLTGFVNAVALNIVVGQLESFTGRGSEAENRLGRAVDTLLHPFEWHLPSLLVGVVTVVMILLLERTRLGALGMVLAIVLGSGTAAALAAWGWPSAVVGDVAQVPRALGAPALPELEGVLSLAVPALSLALVGLVQGAAISGSVPNPDGRYPDASADFRGQGLANLAAGALGGTPVGGSMSATALVRAAGARSALANLVAAVVMAAVVLLAAPAIGYVAMPSLAALLMLVGLRSINLDAVVTTFRTGAVQGTVAGVTLALTLLIPLQYAVLAGTGLAVILHIVRQSNRIVLKRWEFDDGHSLPRESEPPSVLRAGDTVILTPYGSLFFAAAPVVQAKLPSPEGPGEGVAAGATVILRLRGKEELGGTFLRVVREYAQQLRQAGALLLVCGVNERVRRQMDVTGTAEALGPGTVFAAGARVGASLESARAAAARFSANPASFRGDEKPGPRA